MNEEITLVRLVVSVSGAINQTVRGVEICKKKILKEERNRTPNKRK